MTLKLILFLVGSAGIVYVSWRSLRKTGSHGFYRFFAWEAMLGLGLVNSHAWFANPFSALQLLSWMLLIISLILLGFGVHLIRAGKPATDRVDTTLMSFEKTTVLVTSGIYRYIRHPLYGSLLFLTWGAFLKDVSWYSVSLVLVTTICLIATARADETECIHSFGESYRTYMQHSKMFVPFIY